MALTDRIRFRRPLGIGRPARIGRPDPHPEFATRALWLGDAVSIVHEATGTPTKAYEVPAGKSAFVPLVVGVGPGTPSSLALIYVVPAGETLDTTLHRIYRISTLLHQLSGVLRLEAGESIWVEGAGVTFTFDAYLVASGDFPYVRTYYVRGAGTTPVLIYECPTDRRAKFAALRIGSVTSTARLQFCTTAATSNTCDLRVGQDLASAVKIGIRPMTNQWGTHAPGPVFLDPGDKLWVAGTQSGVNAYVTIEEVPR